MSKETCIQPVLALNHQAVGCASGDSRSFGNLVPERILRSPDASLDVEVMVLVVFQDDVLLNRNNPDIPVFPHLNTQIVSARL